VHEEFGSIRREKVRLDVFVIQREDALPISAFWPTFKIVELDDRTKNIALTIRVFEIEELDITIAD
jgi:hypothetical protein